MKWKTEDRPAGWRCALRVDWAAGWLYAACLCTGSAPPSSWWWRGWWRLYWCFCPPAARPRLHPDEMSGPENPAGLEYLERKKERLRNQNESTSRAWISANKGQREQIWIIIIINMKRHIHNLTDANISTCVMEKAGTVGDTLKITDSCMLSRFLLFICQLIHNTQVSYLTAVKTHQMSFILKCS